MPVDENSFEGCSCGDVHAVAPAAHPGYAWSWLAEVITKAGVKVIEQPGWQTRGHGNAGACYGIICHHTAGPKDGNMPSLDVVIHGRPDLTGPLCNVALGRDGTAYVVAAGLAYHAGAGHFNGITSGNSHFVGIEAENVGDGKDPWPAVQMVAYQKICAAILVRLSRPTAYCIGHKEWTTRKIDPTFDMVAFRAAIDILRKMP